MNIAELISLLDEVRQVYGDHLKVQTTDGASVDVIRFHDDATSISLIGDDSPRFAESVASTTGEGIQ